MPTTTRTKVLAPVAIIVAGIAFLGLAAGIFLWSTSKPAVNTSKQTVNSLVASQQLNVQFLSRAQDFVSAAPDTRPGKLGALRQSAKARHAAMVQLLQTQPGKFIELALAGIDREKLPTDVQTDIEQEVNEQGTLQIEHFDNFEKGSSYEKYFLKTDGAQPITLPVYFATAPSTKAAGAKVKLHGWKLDNIFAVSGDSASVSVTTEATTTSTGTKKVAVILFNFTSNQTQPFTPAQTYSFVFTAFNSVKAYYAESSHQQLTLIGDSGGVQLDPPNPNGNIYVYGWYTITADTSRCDYPSWGQAAFNQAPAGALDGFDNYVYIFPRLTSCDFGGVTNLNANKAYINGSSSPYVTAHELGHDFGLNHANSLRCWNASGQPTPISNNCSSTEYGDPWDVMGGRYTHTSNFNQSSMGWFSPGSTQDINLDGVYSLYPLETAIAGQVKELRITKNSSFGSYYKLEFRRPYGVFDNFNTSDPVVNGVTIRSNEYAGYPSYLIDTTMGSGVASLSLSSGGSGYTTAPTVSITPIAGDNGSGAAATSTLASAPIASLSLTSGGSNYTTAPTVSITGGSGTGASATATLAPTSVQSIAVTNGGTKYRSIPIVTIAPPGGNGVTATATAIVQNQSVTSIRIDNAGAGYTSPPAVTIAPPGGNGVTATAANATLTARAVASLSLTSGGSNYTNPTVSITPAAGDSGSGATASAALPPRAVASLTLTSGGSGYTKAPTVTITDGGGTGTAATATLASNTFYDAPLLPGQVFTDPDRGLSLSVSLAPDKSYASVAASFFCAHQNPSLTLLPTSYYVTSTRSVSVTANITNRDTSICGSSSFALGMQLPAGWTQTDTAPITIAPQSTGTLSFTLTAAANVANGSYSFPGTATNQDVPTSTTNTTLWLMLDTVFPNVVITSPAPNAILPRTGSISVSTDATDSNRVDWKTVIIDGVVVRECQTGQISPPCTYTWPITASIASGLHTIVGTGKDYAGNLSQSAITVCYPYNRDGTPASCDRNNVPIKIPD